MVHSLKVFFSVLLILSSSLAFSRPPGNTATRSSGTIYFFSGIGADSTAFANLRLPGFRKVYIKWIPPLPDESITDYACRIKSQVSDEHPYIVGLSFGGILAVEVSKQIPVEKMVLISSASTKYDLNPVQFFFLRMGFYRLVPGAMLQRTNFLTYTYFGAHSPKDKKELKNLLSGTDVSFFRWALKSIARWDNKVPPERTIQIHGTADRIIAYRLLAHPDYTIRGGGHLMVYNKADTISRIITHYFQARN